MTLRDVTRDEDLRVVDHDLIHLLPPCPGPHTTGISLTIVSSVSLNNPNLL